MLRITPGPLRPNFVPLAFSSEQWFEIVECFRRLSLSAGLGDLRLMIKIGPGVGFGFGSGLMVWGSGS